MDDDTFGRSWPYGGAGCYPSVRRATGAESDVYE